jgi:general secretion pathway protein D
MRTIQTALQSLCLAALLTSSAVAQQNEAAAPTPIPAPKPLPAPPPTAPALGEGENEKGLRLNFRGVPLDMVLTYLSDAAGFIVVLDTPVEGKIDVWSAQPLSKQEAIDLLNTVLNKNGYAAIRNGRTLRIVKRDEARTKDIPVRSGNKPAEIAKSDEMVTQVIPVRYANAAQLVQNLRPLIATYAELSSNDSGNALVLTATQSDVRRMVEIVSALDTAINSTSAIKVFPLKFADAKTLADAIKELFQIPQQNQNDRRNQFFNRFFAGGGPGGPGGFPGGGGGGGGGGQSGSPGSGANLQASRVTAVADERANALVVSAPEELVPTIVNLVEEMDIPVTDVTELRVFRLANADPLDLADIFANLFPDETGRNNNSGGNNQGFQFGGGGLRGGFGQGGGGGFGNRNRGQNNSSERMKKMGKVTAVPDQRTSSLIVSAASELMPQIAQMIEQLDASPARKQKVFVYSLENADVQQVEQVVRGMFERSYSSGNRNNNNQNSALSTRSQQTQTTPGTMTGTGFGQGGQGGNGGLGAQFGR